MKKVLKVLLYFLLAIVVIFVIAGVIIAINIYKDAKNYKNGDLYLIYSNDSLDYSKIVSYDKQSFEKRGSKLFHFSGINLFGYNKESVENDNLYLMPRGDFVNQDYNKLVRINSKGKVTEKYSFDGDASPTDYTMNSNYILAVSNLNYEFFIQRLDRKTKELKVIKADENITFVQGLVFCNNEAYGIGNISIDDNNDISSLYHFDFDNNKINKLLEIGDENKVSQNIVCYNNAIYYADDTKLYYYNLDSTKELLDLDNNTPLIIYLNNNIMNLVYSDLVGDNYSSSIDIIYLDGSKDKTNLKIEGKILQVTIDNNNYLWYCILDKNDNYYIKEYDIVNHKEIQSFKVDELTGLFFTGFAIR